MKSLKHLKTIIVHKLWVGYFCFQCNLYWQGIVHDLSKFSPAEFFESVKYYCGDRSPIDKCKEINGYSLSWLHHRGRNKHHYEYWTDNYDKGTTCIKIPWKYALELICDYLGAGKAYGKENFSIQSEIDWWKNKKKVAKMHKETKKLIDNFFFWFSYYGNIEKVLRNKELLNNLKNAYEQGRMIDEPIIEDMG